MNFKDFVGKTQCVSCLFWFGQSSKWESGLLVDKDCRFDQKLVPFARRYWGRRDICSSFRLCLFKIQSDRARKGKTSLMTVIGQLGDGRRGLICENNNYWWSTNWLILLRDKIEKTEFFCFQNVLGHPSSTWTFSLVSKHIDLSHVLDLIINFKRNIIGSSLI